MEHKMQVLWPQEQPAAFPHDPLKNAEDTFGNYYILDHYFFFK